MPLAGPVGSQSSFSGGLDFKAYNLESFKTNIFTLKQVEIDTISNPGHPQTNIITSVVRSPSPSNGVTRSFLEYLPLSIRYDAAWRLPQSTLGFGLGVTRNMWISGTRKELQAITGSPKSTGHWVVINPSFSSDIFMPRNWTLSLRLDGQISTEPLISNEQFGIGGVNSVKGYHEGEAFGDEGWHAGF